jgi:membrane protease YdiL (CAAX protease family)
LAATVLLFGAQYLLQALTGLLTGSLALGHSAGLLLLSFPSLACAGLATLMVMRWKGLGWMESLRFMGLKPLDGKQAALGLVLSLPVLGGYFLAVRNYLGQGTSVSVFPEWPALLVLFVASAGFYEELVFRGFLFQALRPGRSFLSAAALSSLLWALSHWGITFFQTRVRVFFPEMVIFLLGIAGAYVFEKSRCSIWSWMIVHLAIDSIGLVNIGNTGLFRAPIGPSMRYLFGGEALCILFAFPLAWWFWRGSKPFSI